ncbi:30S ribosomal protein S20 [Candidatus Saganbacteria bacterium]|nr:30S ribosomal protein S20 [Candidatus Saganbacteria bacterium]
MKRTASGIKRKRQGIKRNERNSAAKRTVKNAFKTAEKAILAKAGEVKELVNKACSAIDKAVERGILHRNKAARKKSRLLLKLNKASA